MLVKLNKQEISEQIEGATDYDINELTEKDDDEDAVTLDKKTIPVNQAYNYTKAVKQNVKDKRKTKLNEYSAKSLSMVKI